MRASNPIFICIALTLPLLVAGGAQAQLCSTGIDPGCDLTFAGLRDCTAGSILLFWGGSPLVPGSITIQRFSLANPAAVVTTPVPGNPSSIELDGIPAGDWVFLICATCVGGMQTFAAFESVDQPSPPINCTISGTILTATWTPDGAQEYLVFVNGQLVQILPGSASSFSFDSPDAPITVCIEGCEGPELFDLNGDGTPDPFARIRCKACCTAAKYAAGDCNADLSFDLADPVFQLEFIFLGGPAPACEDACDSNDDSQADIADAVWSLSALFLGGPPPAGPFPCARAITDPALSCAGVDCP
ncbi:MAG: hypothetical protein ACE5GW_02450 [Planctomycetota bacterium]